MEKKNRDRVVNLNAHTGQAYIDKYYNYVQIHTNASKNTAGQTGVALVVPEFKVKIGKGSVTDCQYTEMLAIRLAVHWVEDMRPFKAVICYDSGSSLVSLQSSRSESRADVLTEVQQHFTEYTHMCLWIPAHCGVRADEMADRAAKEATKHGVVNLGISLCQTEITSMVRQEMKETSVICK